MSTTSYIQAANLSPEEKLVLEAIRTDVLGVAGTDEGTTAALAIKVKYMDAVATAADFHMAADTGLLGLSALTGGANAAAQSALANAMRTAMDAHMLSIGTRLAVGKHLITDAALEATLAAVPAGSSTATNCTLTIALDAAFIAHGNSSGVHFHDDSTAAGYSVTSNLLAGNATDANCLTELNALLAAMKVHFANGAV